jgi:predicted membrane-bound mannosyltransferase
MSALAIWTFVKTYRHILVPLGVVLLVVIVALTIYGKGRSDAHKADQAKAAAAQAKIDAIASKATTQSAEQRMADTARIDQQLQTVKEAIDAQPDITPSDAALALDCGRLRNAGYNLAKIPACGRFAAAH